MVLRQSTLIPEAKGRTMQRLTVDSSLESDMPDQREAVPARLTTTLYDVLITLQIVGSAEADALVVAIVAHWLRSWPTTFDADVTAAT